MSETHPTYDLSSVLDIDGAETITPGASILLSGPSMLGTEDLALNILADGLRLDEGAIAVTTSAYGDDVVADVGARMDTFDPEQVGCIDCRSDSGRQERYLDAGGYVYSVPEPSDFTGIGIGITNSFDVLENQNVTKSRFALSSLSTMITYSDRQTVFKFCHVLSERLDSAGYLGVFTIDSGVHDEQTMSVLKQAFDGLIELRENDGQREARLLGLRPEPTDWMTLEAD